MVVLGGVGSMFGSVVPNCPDHYSQRLYIAFADYRMVAYAIVLILVMIFRPEVYLALMTSLCPALLSAS